MNPEDKTMSSGLIYFRQPQFHQLFFVAFVVLSVFL